jgi:hypothetical protein
MLGLKLKMYDPEMQLKLRRKHGEFVVRPLGICIVATDDVLKPWRIEGRVRAYETPEKALARLQREVVNRTEDEYRDCSLA